MIVPTIEEVVEMSKGRRVGLLATQATVGSGTYEREIRKVSPEVNFYQQAAPKLVELIESGDIYKNNKKKIVKKYLDRLFEQDSQIDTVILGCTHYPLIRDIFKEFLPKKGIQLIAQSDFIAGKLNGYLARHPALESKLERDGMVEFLTTGDKKVFDEVASELYGEQIDSKVVSLG